MWYDGSGPEGTGVSASAICIIFGGPGNPLQGEFELGSISGGRRLGVVQPIGWRRPAE
jgi:hypothetical protein